MICCYCNKREGVNGTNVCGAYYCKEAHRYYERARKVVSPVARRRNIDRASLCIDIARNEA